MRGWVSIDDNASLTVVDFPSLTATGRGFTISNNESITNLDGFSSLQIVRGNLYIAHNNSLQDIEGLFGLESVGSWAYPIGPDAGNFVVTYNPELSLEQAEQLAYDVIGEHNIGGGIIIR
jgi:hypothetical protein